VLSNIPDLTRAVGVPRLCAIEHPFGLTVGRPEDQAGQMAVLRAVLQGLVEMTKPGSIIDLPYSWSEADGKLQLHPPQRPPIGEYLVRHPWLYPRLLSRNIPPSGE
jgi:hypothetical protein